MCYSPPSFKKPIDEKWDLRKSQDSEIVLFFKIQGIQRLWSQIRNQCIKIYLITGEFPLDGVRFADSLNVAAKRALSCLLRQRCTLRTSYGMIHTLSTLAKGHNVIITKICLFKYILVTIGVIMLYLRNNQWLWKREFLPGWKCNYFFLG